MPESRECTEGLSSESPSTSITPASEPQKRNKLLRDHLKREFNISDEFMDLAVKIWWDGKED